jgi:hypothetical protein
LGGSREVPPDIVVPDVERVVGGLRVEMNARLDEVLGHFDAIDQRLDRLETGYQMVLAG